MPSNKRFQKETLTILYLKCPICAEPSHIGQWAIECFDNPTYQCSVSKAQQINDDSLMICPKCLRSCIYSVLMHMQ